ncbi:MAG TPA: DUF72 domain-containing protein [Actinomycetota bacterium]|nr:DUF72 domain-containing protein [Actinomycetota bacterium]
MGSLYAGTSGFSFKEWKGPFYPEDLKDKQMLQYYSSKLGTVEINYTFRRMPAETTIEGWKLQTEESFRFTLKAPQRITHWKRLVDAQEDVDEFVRRGKGLGDRLGTILFQLPPNFSYDKSVLTDFLTGLPPVARFAMEFRNATFDVDEVRDLLSEHQVAFCGADTDEKALTNVPVTAGHVYLRLRKQDYNDEDIKMWAERVSALLKSGSDVFCYFKHEEGGAGPKLALQLIEETAKWG